MLPIFIQLENSVILRVWKAFLSQASISSVATRMSGTLNTWNIYSMFAVIHNKMLLFLQCNIIYISYEQYYLDFDGGGGMQNLYTDLHTRGFPTQYFLQIMTSPLIPWQQNNVLEKGLPIPWSRCSFININSCKVSIICK